MTPKQRDALSSLRTHARDLALYASMMHRQMVNLSGLLDRDMADDGGDFAPQEIDQLLRLNRRLTDLETYLVAVGRQESARLDVRVADPDDPLTDYEIQATLDFILREDDPAFDEDDDNILTVRTIFLKYPERDEGPLGDAKDWREPLAYYPGDLGKTPHCWLFHDLNGHSYGLEQPCLSLRDCLRVGNIWLDVAVIHQTNLDIPSGQWVRFGSDNQ